MYLQEAGNTLALNPQPFCQQIYKKKNTLWENELLNMFFHRCRYKNSCFGELAHNSSVLELIQLSASWDSKKDVLIFKMLLLILCFWILVLKLYPIQVVISLQMWLKLYMGQLFLCFICNFCNCFRYVGGALVTNLFSLLLVDPFWLFRKL